MGHRTPRRRVASPSDADLVSDLKREVKRAQRAKGRNLSSRTKSTGSPSTLRLSDEQARPRRHIAPSTTADPSSEGEAARATERLVIVRAYNPASDLEQRLSRIYALLSLPPTSPGDHNSP
jgi:hypothetical protein